MRTQHPQANTSTVTTVEASTGSVDSTRPTMRVWLKERIDLRWAIGLFVAWLVLPEIAYVLEPPARGSEPFFGTTLEVSMNVLFIVTLAGLVARRRWGLAASLVGAIVLTVASIACPASGHHTFGAWWYGQMACMVTLVAVSVAALSRGPKVQPAP